jgi:hypothetical protein
VAGSGATLHLLACVDTGEHVQCGPAAATNFWGAMDITVGATRALCIHMMGSGAGAAGTAQEEGTGTHWWDMHAVGVDVKRACSGWWRPWMGGGGVKAIHGLLMGAPAKQIT